MQQIDLEVLELVAGVQLRHSPEIIRHVAAWQLASAAFAKLRKSSTAKQDKPDALYMAHLDTINMWRKSHMAAINIGEPAFESALTDLRRAQATINTLAKIDELDACQ